MCPSKPKIPESKAAAPPPAPPAPNTPEAPVFNEDTPANSLSGNRRGTSVFRIPLNTNKSLNSGTGINIPNA